MFIARSPASLTSELDNLRRQGGTRRCISLVTTKGTLHDGHGAVMNAAKTVSDVVVVTLIALEQAGESGNDNVVSASEFHDIGVIEQHDIDILYLCADHQLFPDGSEQAIGVKLPEPAHRCIDSPNAELSLTAHLKLINLVQPDIMVWGEKNFIQYRQVRRMVHDLSLRTQLQCIPTVRHANGLALSANNDRLNPQQREVAPILYETLKNVAHAIRTGARNFNNLEKTARLALREAGFEIRSLCILDEHKLVPADEHTDSFRILASTRLGGIDIHDSLGLHL